MTVDLVRVSELVPRMLKLVFGLFALCEITTPGISVTNALRFSDGRDSICSEVTKPWGVDEMSNLIGLPAVTVPEVRPMTWRFERLASVSVTVTVAELFSETTTSLDPPW